LAAISLFFFLHAGYAIVVGAYGIQKRGSLLLGLRRSF
jgi:hypothetical protein